MASISASVGRNCVNAGTDVRTVRKLLNQNRHLLAPYADLPETDSADEELFARIETYQTRLVTLAPKPDGRVDPNGATISKLNTNAKDLPQKIPLFPLFVRPAASYYGGARYCGAPRPGGRRHAGCDLLAPVGTKIRAMDDGKVIQKPYHFYKGTLALEIDHGGYVARYGEISRAAPGLDVAGANVKKGDVIGYVGKLTSSSMLHLELYSKASTGSLTGQGPYKRRADLMNPGPFLDAASMEPTDEKEPLAFDTATGRVGPRVTGGLNLRKAAKVDAQSITRLETGSVFKILRRVEGGQYTAFEQVRTDWFEIETDTTKGFVAAYYVDVQRQTGRVNNKVTTSVAFRGSAKPDGKAIAALQAGTTVLVVAQVAGGEYAADGNMRSDWLSVEYAGRRGFLAAYFVDIVNVHTEPATHDKNSNKLLFEYSPKGASDKTAKQDGLPEKGIHGVAASEAMAKVDRQRVMKYKQHFINAGKEMNLPPALLAAIASRESRGGAALKNGYGDHGHGFGLMQIDDRSWAAEIHEGPFGYAHILQATEILRGKLDQVSLQFESLTDAGELQTAVSRYNGGKRRPAPSSDIGTTGGDYSEDVWARALYYAREETW